MGSSSKESLLLTVIFLIQTAHCQLQVIYFSHHCVSKTPEEGDMKEEEFVWAHSLREAVDRGGEAWWQEEAGSRTNLPSAGRGLLSAPFVSHLV